MDDENEEIIKTSIAVKTTLFDFSSRCNKKIQKMPKAKWNKAIIICAACKRVNVIIQVKSMTEDYN